MFNTEEPVIDVTDPQQTETLVPKKQFIEPEITTPVDVLEATTFFQSVSSGATN